MEQHSIIILFYKLNKVNASVHGQWHNFILYRLYTAHSGLFITTFIIKGHFLKELLGKAIYTKKIAQFFQVLGWAEVCKLLVPYGSAK